MQNKDTNNKVSVVIATRNRAKDLAHCLIALSKQTLTPDELLVIDNNSTDLTHAVVDLLLRTKSLSVKYLKCQKVGYPYVYQFGLDAANYNWVAFIDDDCVPSRNWYQEIKQTIVQNKECSVILGSTDEHNIHSSVALTKAYIDEVGKLGAIEKNKVMDFEILDSKNIVYNRLFLKKNKVGFDIGLLNYGNGASEDCDMGMQIFKANGVAIYNEKIKAKHKNPVSVDTYYKKLFFTLKNHLIYEEKWSEIRIDIHTKRTLYQKITLFINFCKKYNLNLLLIALVFFHICLTFVLVKTFRLFFSRDISRLNVAKV